MIVAKSLVKIPSRSGSVKREKKELNKQPAQEPTALSVPKN